VSPPPQSVLEPEKDRPPIPPADLILRVAPSFGADDIDAARTAFDLDAIDHLRHFEWALAGVGHTLVDFDRVLDFGCGCGRFIRHMGPIASQVEIHGTDIDQEMIRWLRQNVLFGSFEVAPLKPPLPYPDHHFDLVINHSVFTHLNEEDQDLWLAELARITKPGALLLLTTEGRDTWNSTVAMAKGPGDDPERWRGELETRGILELSQDAFIGSTHPDWYHSTYHAPWYVFEHWTRFLDLVTYSVNGSNSQDLVVMRRRPDGAPQARPIGHRGVAEASDPSGAQTSDTPSSGEPSDQLEDTLDLKELRREISMLRAGMYEQGSRISVLAAQLRDEIDAVRAQSHDDGWTAARTLVRGSRRLRGSLARVLRQGSRSSGS
jgi:SAM-dependent methyltransferase